MPVCVEGYTPKGGHHELPNKNKYLMLLDVTAAVRDSKEPAKLLLSAATVYTGKEIKEALYGYRPGYPYVLYDKFKDSLFVFDLTNMIYRKLVIGNLASKVNTTSTMAMAWIEEPTVPDDKSWSGKFIASNNNGTILLEIFLRMPVDMIPCYLDASNILEPMHVSVLKARLQGLIPDM
jgi:hypothetical protein